ncbi:MAG: hypothetical protein EAY81_10020 [Bacteroidetes bacterium]|nr:MAG: hypothetical protein EAY81_10020 [Bacteroidota bacterium]
MFIINRIVFVFNSIAILALLASYLAPYLSPDLLWPLAFLGLAFPIIVLVNVLFVIYWACFLNMKFLFSLAAIVIGWNNMAKFIQFGKNQSSQQIENSIKVVTFNARYFGVFEGNPTEDSDIFEDKLEKINPDILCFQEMFIVHDASENQIQQLIKKKYSSYNKANIKVTDTKWNCDNIGILSRYPIIKQGIVEHDSNTFNYTIFADVVALGDTIRIINTHLQSIKFESKEYEAVKEISLETNKEKVSTYKGIISKMKYAFLMRAKQTDAIEQFISESPYKIILCGDFNDSPLSYAYRTIKADMKDAFMEAGSGLGRTYVGKMPSFRIDYIMGDDQFEFFDYYSKAFSFSDHKMVSCSIKLK